MSECPTCAGLLGDFDAVQASNPPALAEFEAACAHLVAAHLAQLPGYLDGCPNCGEWAALVGDSSDGLAVQYGRAVVPLLGWEDLRHRAGHLVAPA
jgi:hypothetical protein